MNRADEHLGHARDVIESLASSGDDALLQLCARLVCKREHHDVARQKPFRCAGRKQLHHAARNDFCLAGARASDELEVATAVGDGLLLGDREFHAPAPFASKRFAILMILRPGDASISRSTTTFCVPGASPGQLRLTPRITEMAGNTGICWRARRDSNSRPPDSKSEHFSRQQQSEVINKHSLSCISAL
jgi:hypothetical protein